ncbi:MAG: SH3 domain-containing protein [Lachnospiraceae bacterium]|nr:SH3 domain-containing protein [Lachnospiraceae bacterium]
MMKLFHYAKISLSVLAVLSLTAGIVTPAHASPAVLPDVTEDMCDPAYWAERSAPADPWKSEDGAGDPSEAVADLASLQALNQLFVETEGLNMQDLTKAEEVFDGTDLCRRLWKTGMSEISAYLSGGYFDRSGETVTGPFLVESLMNMEDPGASPEQELRYGICVNRSNIRAFPSDEIVTDAIGDNDFDYFQLSSLRVNEPVLVRLTSADERYYYVDSSALSGWVLAEDIAVCADKEEWRSAWDIPEDRILVVTGGKFFLEKSNTSPRLSGRMLTMGTVLEMADPEEAGELVSNRSSYHNYIVWLPVRQEDGSYAKEAALISEHHPVHEGYLPLTTENILETAFSMLGDAYGWGGMLDSNDCSGYLRDIYRCFGLELPRNTTWQSAMPVAKYDVQEMETAEKQAILDRMPAGTLLYFKGHGMMYLGHEGDRYYVISSFSSMLDPDGVTRRRVRSVSVNTLDTLRANGNTWLEDIHTILIPYLDGSRMAQEKGEAEDDPELSGKDGEIQDPGEGREQYKKPASEVWNNTEKKQMRPNAPAEAEKPHAADEVTDSPWRKAS